jgi:hypothetical protein
MVTACQEVVPEPELLDHVQRRAEGVPLLVEKLVAAGARSGATVVPTTVFEATTAGGSPVASGSSVASTCSPRTAAIRTRRRADSDRARIGREST